MRKIWKRPGLINIFLDGHWLLYVALEFSKSETGVLLWENFKKPGVVWNLEHLWSFSDDEKYGIFLTQLCIIRIYKKTENNFSSF